MELLTAAGVSIYAQPVPLFTRTFIGAQGIDAVLVTTVGVRVAFIHICNMNEAKSNKEAAGK